jgi:lysophospholipase L1-like esterase
MVRTLLVALATLAQVPDSPKEKDFPLRDGLRVVFLGDSITNYGVYIQDIEAYLYTRFPDRKVEIINLGLSAETVSGITEPGHPYPRPDIRTRLGRALEQTKPNLVIVCYGMNDGIYHPPAPERLDLYKKGIEEVLDRVKKAGADVILATPPPFDPRPVRARLQPLGAKSYGFRNAYEDYDGVLEEYAGWLLSKRADGWKVIDVHGDVERFVDGIRKSDPDFTLAPDGVHPDATGHWLIAQAFLKAWDAPGEVDSATIDFKPGGVTTGKIQSTSRDGRFLRIEWITRVPMPHDPKWDPRLADLEMVDRRFNRHRLAVTGLDRPRYSMTVGDQTLGDFTREQLAEGVDLARFPDLSINRRAAQLRELVAERHWSLNPAWLQAIGHEPPVLPEALPLEEARKKGEALEARIRELARPVPISIVLAPSNN